MHSIEKISLSKIRKLTGLLAIFILIGCKEQPAAKTYGRYQIVRNALSVGGKKTSTLIDTESGHVWVAVESNKEFPVLFPVPVLNDSTLLSTLGETYDEHTARRFKNMLERSRQEEEDANIPTMTEDEYNAYMAADAKTESGPVAGKKEQKDQK